MRRNLLFVSIFICSVILFFLPFLISSKFPIPSDTIVGLYHPYRDFYSTRFSRGIPFKNFLITDPVRQQLPWRMLAIEKLKKFELPFWNPYNFAGIPLLGNIQNAALYPLNILLFIFPFEIGWSILIILQIILSGLFFYFYSDNLRLNRTASLLGSMAFSYSGFSIAWLTWNTVIHVGLWLPLLLLSIDKLFYFYKIKVNNKTEIHNKKLFIWSSIFIFGLVSSFLAGHLQTFFYLFIVQLIYFLLRWLQNRRKIEILFIYSLLIILFLFFTFIQWLPALFLIIESARGVDLVWIKEGWFLPWQNLLQFIIPDFFGNPSTLNYWGIWNYGEFIGYIGLFPLIMAVYAIFFRFDKKTLFFGILFFFSLVFALPTYLAKIQFFLNIPFISSAQPTRLIYVADFSLAVLCSLGLDYYIKTRSKIFYILSFFGFVFLILNYFIFYNGTRFFQVNPINIDISIRNTYLPIILFISITILMFFSKYTSKKNFTLIIFGLILISALDLLRFANKFTPFITKEYFYPNTKSITFLKNNNEHYRIMTSDDRILPPNFSMVYKIASIDGYDPLFLMRYGELIASNERNKPNINPPFGFNRIVTPKKYDTKIIDLLGVKYILSLTDLKSNKLNKVFQEGETRIYENSNVMDRVFFVENLILADDKYDAIEKIFDPRIDLSKTAIVEPDTSDKSPLLSDNWRSGTVKIVKYEENNVIIETRNDADGFLVFTDTYYAGWNALMDEKTDLNIFRTDFNFRGVVVPKGKHLIRFYMRLF